MGPLYWMLLALLTTPSHHHGVSAIGTRDRPWTPRWKPKNSTQEDGFAGVDAHNGVCNATNAPRNYFIYCTGRILEAVNYHRLYNDSKDFVDSPLAFDPIETQSKFDAEFGQNYTEDIDPVRLRSFVSRHFLPPGSELRNCTPKDWQLAPAKLMAIVDPAMRKWALELNAIWKELCKQVRPEIADQPERYSLIYTPYEFIAPGGRFREFYYWDSYWIIRGLMASEMYFTAAQMIRNLALMVEQYGFVPNGGRIYYLSRSQPPLLTAMVYEYYVNTNNATFLREMLPILDKELAFWDTYRSVKVHHSLTGERLKAFRYYADSNVPRPESYKEDMTSSENFNTVEERQYFYRSMSSAAESGWDFSTRWLRNLTDLSSIETIDILPVDLNSFMCWNYKLLRNLWRMAGNVTQPIYYHHRKDAMQDVVEKLFYHAEQGAWYDFNLRVNGSRDTNFYPSRALPLFARCYDGLEVEKPERLYKLWNDSGVFSFPGGIPASMIHKSGEQWDFPNGWPPSNHMVIEGLRKSENPYSQEQGFRLAEKWVYGNYRVYLETGKMWEKYNVAEEKPAVGGGGEYQVQYGYGWTNGVILDLLTAYYDRFEWREASDAGSHLDEGGHNGGEREVVRYGFGWINAIILDLISAYYHHFEPNDGSGASNRLDDGVHGGEGNAGVRLLTSRNWLFPLISVASIAVLSNSSFLR